MSVSAKGLSISAWAVLVLLAPLLVITVHAWITLVSVPVTFDYGPGFIAISVHRFAQGGVLYRDFRQPPYLALPYSPIFPVLAGLLSRLIGNNPMAALAAQRLLTILSTLSVCGLIFWLARQMGARGGAAAIVSIAFALSPTLSRSAFEGRVDMLGVAWELAGIGLFMSGFSYTALGFFVLSFFTKQMFMAGIGTVVLYLVLNGQVRQAVSMAAGWVASVALLTVVFQLLSPYYWLNVWSAISVLYDFWAPPSMLSMLVLANFPIFALAVVAVLRRGPRASFAVCLLVVTCLRDTASSIHWGSNVNYFLPTLAAASFVAAPELDRVLHAAERLPALAQVLLGVGIAWLVTQSAPVWRWRPPVPNRPGYAEVAARVAHIPGRVITDIPELVLTEVSPGIEAIEPMLLESMLARGTFDDRPLITEVEARKIGAFVLSPVLGYHNRAVFWPALREAIERNYDPVARKPGRAFILLPKSG